jgi:hypothetical protein
MRIGESKNKNRTMNQVVPLKLNQIPDDDAFQAIARVILASIPFNLRE